VTGIASLKASPAQHASGIFLPAPEYIFKLPYSILIDPTPRLNVCVRYRESSQEQRMKFKEYSKVAVIVLVALLLAIPLGMIAEAVHERNNYRNEVIGDIERTWTGAQRVAGPVLSVPYLIDVTEPFINKTTGKEETRTRRYTRNIYRVARSLSVTGNAQTQIRSRGIYSVPVYSSELSFAGSFDVSDLKEVENLPGFVRFGQPAVSLSFSDIRGIEGTPALQWNGEALNFSAGSLLPNVGAGVHAEVSLPVTTQPIPVNIEVQLRGSQELSFAPLAQELTVQLESTWPHPKFDGQFLPEKRQISEQGFSSSWRMSSFATNAESKLSSCANNGDCYSLQQLSFGVKFFEPVDLYVKVNRAIKYGALFILLTFVAFFLTETLTHSRLHPTQYALVGLALAVFYLLLVSLSEHIPFARAYLVATLCCVGLIGVYLKSALHQGRLAIFFSGGISLLYGMLFFILRSEDFALLMGAMLVFLVLAIVMLMTRRINWYELGGQPDSGNSAENS